MHTMQHNTSNIETINDLIEINNDRIQGYDRLIGEVAGTHSTDAIRLFQQYKQESQANVAALTAFVHQMGGEAVTGTTVGGALHRLWIDIKNTFVFNEKESALESSVFGDGAAIKAYEAALAIEDADRELPAEVRSTLQKQLADLRKAHAANTAYEQALEDAKLAH